MTTKKTSGRRTIHHCGLCDWQTIDPERDDAAYQHLLAEHDLRTLWLNGIAEQ
jgi:hypothetical protein